MGKIITLKENELKEIVVNIVKECLRNPLTVINETSHYPEFLDSFKNRAVKDIVQRLLADYRTPFLLQADPNEYVKYIKVTPIPFIPDTEMDFNNPDSYSAAYLPDGSEYKDGSLVTGDIQLRFPVDKYGNINTELISETIIHELNHLFDDWMKRTQDVKRGMEPKPLQYPSKYADINDALKSALVRPLAYMAYYSIQTETQAFLSTVPMEFQRCRLKSSNKDEAARRTNTYKNLADNFKILESDLERDNEYLFRMMNDRVKKNYRKAGIPFMEEFDWKVYKPMITKWINRCYKDFLMKYFSLVNNYIKENDVEEKNLQASPFWHPKNYGKVDADIMNEMVFEYRHGVDACL